MQPNILGTATAATVPAVLASTSTITTGTNTTNIEQSLDSKNDAISLSPSRSFTSTSSPPRVPYDEFPNRDETRVMIAGCGNSSLPFDMIQAGWTAGIVGVDFSPIVISQMNIKASQSQAILETVAAKSKQPEDILKFACADLTQPLPEYADGSFDLIIVKGSFDAILCSSGSRASTLKLIQNCVRLLSPKHGVLFLVTTGNPDNRLEYLEHKNDLTHYWRNVSVHPLRNSTASSCQPSYVTYSHLLCTSLCNFLTTFVLLFLAHAVLYIVTYVGNVLEYHKPLMTQKLFQVEKKTQHALPV